MNKDKMLICALATPYLDNKLDVKSYIKLLKYQQRGRVDALLALGTTAEAQLLYASERKLLVDLAVSATNLPVFAGIEEPSTLKAAKQAELYAKCGAAALLVAPPSFCKCTPKGYVKHIETIIKAADLPVILYNIPARAGYSLDLEAVRSLSDKVRYVKDSCADTTFAQKIKPYCNVLCGSDEKLADYLDADACGVISVTANVAPKLTRQALNGENTEEFCTLANLITNEINPVAIKYILHKAGIFASCEMRLPLTEANKHTRALIDEWWKAKKHIIR